MTEGWTRSLDGTESDQRALGIQKGFKYFLDETNSMQEAQKQERTHQVAPKKDKRGGMEER